MRGLSSRSITGLILGWIIAFEGFFALSLTDMAVIEGIGGIRASTFSLAATQLALLGVLITSIWAFRPLVESFNRPILTKALSAVNYLAMATVALEGLVMIQMAGDIFITDFGGISEKYVVLTGAQLFALGALSLRQWRLKNIAPSNWLVDTLGISVAALLMVEGLTAMGIAGDTTIQGFGGIAGGTVSLAGLQLFLLGLLMLGLWTLVSDPLLGARVRSFLTERRSLIAMTVLGAIVALEGAIASLIAGTVIVQGIGGASKVYVVAGCAQLFLLGALAPLLWKIRERKVELRSLPELLAVLAMALLAFEGIFAVGLAADTHIDGIGTIMESTFRYAGLQLTVLATIGLLAFLVHDSPLLGGMSRRLVWFMPLSVMTLIGLEGLAATVLAANIRIAEFSGVGKFYVILGGVQLVLLSCVALTCWSRTEGMTRKFKCMFLVAALFLAMMLPIAIML